MRFLLIGNKGQLGWELERALAPLGDVRAFDQPEIELTDGASLNALVREEQPDILVNAAAYTAVDNAESDMETAELVNAVAPGIMADACRALGALFVHYSTDFVFDGEKGAPYIESDAPNPLNVYGRTKLEGEQNVVAAGGRALILRTSWVYSLRRPSFVTKVIEWAGSNEELRIVDDQTGSPTWCRMLAEATSLLLARASQSDPQSLELASGLYHLAGAGSASRYAWAESILGHMAREGSSSLPALRRAKSAEFPSPAQRPHFSALDNAGFKARFGFDLPPWQRALGLAMADPR